MPVRVTTNIQVEATQFSYPEATQYVATEDGRLSVHAADGRAVASHAPETWAVVEVLPEPSSAIAVTITLPEHMRDKRWEDLSRVDRELLRLNAATAVEVFLKNRPPAPVVNAAAEPTPRAEGGPISPTLAYSGPDEREAFIPTEAVLSETTEPYVSVNLSVTSDDADQVLKVIRSALRDDSLRVPTKALA